MPDTPIRCSVITPERTVLETEASAVVFPAHDGLVGVLKNRAPLVCQLGIGVLRVDSPSGGSREFFIDGGFAEVRGNEISILTPRAAAAEELSKADAEKAAAAAAAMPLTSDEAFETRQQAVARAAAQSKIAKK